MPVSELTAVVYIDGEAVPCTEVRVSIDEGWSPYVQVDVTIPWTTERAAALDPRDYARVQVEILRHWMGSLTLNDLSATWQGMTLDDLSAEWVGLTLDDLTELWATAWESGIRAADRFDADLVVRRRRIEHTDATISITATSDELLAQCARSGGVYLPVQPLPLRILALLRAAGVEVVWHDLTAGDIYTSLPEMTTDWGRSAWDAASGAAADLGMRLWCGPDRVWRLAPADAPATETVAMPRVSTCEDAVDLDGTYADVLVWTGAGTNSEGLPITDTKVWPDPLPPGPHTVHHEHRDYGHVGAGLPMPSDAEMAARLAALTSRDRSLTITAPADPSMRTGVALTTGAPSLPAMAAVVARVEWAIPADVMTIATRSTTED